MRLIGEHVIHDIWKMLCVFCLVWFGLVLWHIYHCSLFNTKSILMHKTVLFQIVQFSISILFNSIYPINRTLSGATIPGQSGPGSDDNEGVPRIPQTSKITGTAPSDRLMSHPEQKYCVKQVQTAYWTLAIHSHRDKSSETPASYLIYCYIWTYDRAINQEMHLCK